MGGGCVCVWGGGYFEVADLGYHDRGQGRIQNVGKAGVENYPQISEKL